MLHRLRAQLGTAGLVIAVVALVLTTMGVAVAAKGALTGKQKKEVQKIAAKYQGTGPQGAPGAPGQKGDQGPQGSQGSQGEAGPGLIVEPLSIGETECGGFGGAIVGEEGDTGVEVCNGEPGKDGSPWTAKGTLPPGATEVGAYSVVGTADDTEGVAGAISFPVLLEKPALSGAHVHFVKAGETDLTCTAANHSLPTAPPGELCVYETVNNGSATFEGIFNLGLGANGASRSGALLKFTMSGVGLSTGSFAVTGCSTELPEGDPNKCPV